MPLTSAYKNSCVEKIKITVLDEWWSEITSRVGVLLPCVSFGGTPSGRSQKPSILVDTSSEYDFHGSLSRVPASSPSESDEADGVSVSSRPAQGMRDIILAVQCSSRAAITYGVRGI
jgi:hypothetical protein